MRPLIYIALLMFGIEIAAAQTTHVRERDGIFGFIKNTVFASNCDSKSDFWYVLLHEDGNRNVYFFMPPDIVLPINYTQELDSVWENETRIGVLGLDSRGEDFPTQTYINILWNGLVGPGKNKIIIRDVWKSRSGRSLNNENNTFMVRAGVIPKTGISSPYVTACAAESEATIATMKKLFPNFDYLGGVRAQKAKEKAEELERAKWAKINEENQRKCSQLVASYLDQCATAGNVENCVTIKSKGNIYYAPGPFSLGWNCR